MATALKVTVSPERISLRPGESADVELTIQNASQVVEHFSASVVGLPSNELFSCEPDVVKLRPKEVGTLRLRVDVPERGGMVAGPYTLGVVVKSPYSQEVSRCEELPLDVQPAPSLTMGVQPEIVNGGKTGTYVVNLANEGNMPMAVTLSGSDPENRVGFKFEPREIRLEPGMVAGAQVTVNSDTPLTGQEIRRAMTLRANAGETTVERPVTFVQGPRIRGGWMKFGALAAGLAVLGGMTYGGAKLLRDLKPENAANSQPQTQNQANQNNLPQQVPPVQPSQAASPPAPPSQPAPLPTQPVGPQPANTTPVPANVVVDFTVDKTGQPFVADKYISEEQWADKGITMSNVIERAPQPCRDATQQAIRILLPGDPRIKVSGAGTIVTTVRPTDIRACSMVPIKMSFFKPLTTLNVFFTALPGIKYTAKFEFEDGTTKEFEAPGTKIGDKLVIGHQVVQGQKAIISVTFGHSASVAPSQESVTMLKGVSYTTVP
jgi:hypothetical protein